MVMLVWWILSLFGVCSFGWIPVMIDAIIALIICGTQVNDDSKVTLTGFAFIISIGVGIYAFCAQFLSLLIPFWGVFLSPIWFLVALFVPGGFTVTNIIFQNFGVMLVPLWVFIVGVIADIFILAIMIYEIVNSIRNNR